MSDAADRGAYVESDQQIEEYANGTLSQGVFSHRFRRARRALRVSNRQHKGRRRESLTDGRR